eukprot:TRINITY_DN2585_c0_g2_i8.p1 TRINITY_DN2585_c0_g2~~TRINITY_DN2585_c0_g2_i8.p1  ORF type:complete len:338 (+),score=16.67 TRINITY_DN2585_c0_g2_i8:226-1239(+)
MFTHIDSGDTQHLPLQGFDANVALHVLNIGWGALPSGLRRRLVPRIRRSQMPTSPVLRCWPSKAPLHGAAIIVLDCQASWSRFRPLKIADSQAPWKMFTHIDPRDTRYFPLQGFDVARPEHWLGRSSFRLASAFGATNPQISDADIPSSQVLAVHGCTSRSCNDSPAQAPLHGAAIIVLDCQASWSRFRPLKIADSQAPWKMFTHIDSRDTRYFPLQGFDVARPEHWLGRSSFRLASAFGATNPQIWDAAILGSQVLAVHGCTSRSCNDSPALPGFVEQISTFESCRLPGRRPECNATCALHEFAGFVAIVAQQLTKRRQVSCFVIPQAPRSSDIPP